MFFLALFVGLQQESGRADAESPPPGAAEVGLLEEVEVEEVEGCRVWCRLQHQKHGVTELCTSICCAVLLEKQKKKAAVTVSGVDPGDT